MKLTILSRKSSRQSGSIILMAALLLTLVLGVGALVIDLGYAFVVRNELQNAADATALAGAACLAPRVECGNAGASSPDWNTASLKASGFISKNKADDVALTNGTISYGYWNMTGSPSTLQTLPHTPVANDLPAIQVTISKAPGVNGGGVRVFLAGIFGVNFIPVAATAVAVLQSNVAATGTLFPLAISKCMYDTYWDSTTGQPKKATSTNPAGFNLPQIIGQPYFFTATSGSMTGACQTGEWSSLDVDSNNVPTIRDIIANGNPNQMATGDSVWIEPGSKTTLYGDVNGCSAAGDKSCEYVMMPVVVDVSSHSSRPTVGFACVHILSAAGGSSKTITVQMSADTTHCISTGGSTGYGSAQPPRLAL